MDKAEIDRQAEREGLATWKQGCQKSDRRVEQKQNYNQERFDRLFRGK